MLWGAFEQRSCRKKEATEIYYYCEAIMYTSYGKPGNFVSAKRTQRRMNSHPYIYIYIYIHIYILKIKKTKQIKISKK